MKTIPVFMAADDNYAAIASVAIISIAENTRHPVSIYFIDNGITPGNKDKISSIAAQYKNLAIEFIELDINLFKDFRTYAHVSITTFARLMIPWLKPEIDRALWMDVDTVCMGDIAELYNENLDGHPLGAAKCIEIVHTPDFAQKVFKNIDLSARHTYFNAGILVLDCAAWRADKNLPTGFFEIEQRYPNHICADQDILNKYFENNYKLLNQKYNVTICNKACFNDVAEYNDTMDNMVVRHFIGSAKAHNSTTGIAVQHLSSYDAFWKYAQKSEFFGEFLLSLVRSANHKVKERYWLKLFGIIPFIKRRYQRYYLFGLIPFATIK